MQYNSLKITLNIHRTQKFTLIKIKLITLKTKIKRRFCLPARLSQEIDSKNDAEC